MSLFYINRDMPFVSVIIVNYNGLKNLGILLDECIESVIKMEYPKFEIIFVDNASTDHSVEYVRRKYGCDSKFKVIGLNNNYGWVGGVNRGYKYAKGNVLAILNNDVVVTPEWLAQAVQMLQRNKNAVIVTPKLISNIAIGGGEIDVVLVGNGRPAVKTRMDTSCFFPSGAAFIIERKIIEIFGEVFDNDYFAYYDDIDLGWRCQLLNFSVLYCPTSIVFHKHGGSFGVASPFKFYLMRRNALYSATKNVSTLNFLKLLPIWLSSTLFAAYFFYKATNNIKYLNAVIKVFFSYTYNFKKIWKKHVVIQALRKVDDDAIFGKFSNTIYVGEQNTNINHLALAFINTWFKIFKINLEIVGCKIYPTIGLLSSRSTEGSKTLIST